MKLFGIKITADIDATEAREKIGKQLDAYEDAKLDRKARAQVRFLTRQAAQQAENQLVAQRVAAIMGQDVEVKTPAPYTPTANGTQKLFTVNAQGILEEVPHDIHTAALMQVPYEELAEVKIARAEAAEAKAEAEATESAEDAEAATIARLEAEHGGKYVK